MRGPDVLRIDEKTKLGLEHGRAVLEGRAAIPVRLSLDPRPDRGVGLLEVGPGPGDLGWFDAGGGRTPGEDVVEGGLPKGGSPPVVNGARTAGTRARRHGRAAVMRIGGPPGREYTRRSPSVRRRPGHGGHASTGASQATEAGRRRRQAAACTPQRTFDRTGTS